MVSMAAPCHAKKKGYFLLNALLHAHVADIEILLRIALPSILERALGQS